MATLHSILFTSVLIGIAAFFYEVQGAPTGDRSAHLGQQSVSKHYRCHRGKAVEAVDADVDAADAVVEEVFCRSAASAVVEVVAGAAVVSHAELCTCIALVRASCCCTSAATCCRPCCGCGCGCCGCGGGGGGRKRRSLDNLRIRLGAKKLAELKGEEHSSAEYPRQKRDIMCHNECVLPAGGHLGHEHEIYGDY
ncbi:hypothetical protein OSTOST_04430 [Ostertagia ostertagi]